MTKRALLLSFFIVSTLLLKAQTSWQNVPGLYGSTVSGMARTSDGKLFAAASTGLFRSSDEGESWTKVLSGGIWDVFVAHDDAIYVIINAQSVYVSQNKGDSFTYVGQPPVQISKVRKLPNNKLVVYSYSGDKIYVSDNGSSWTLQHTFASSDTFSKIHIIGSKIFMLGSGRGLEVSEDNGATFVSKNNGIANVSETWQSLAWDGNTTLYRAAQWNVYRSTDLGESWQDITYNLIHEGLAGSLTINDVGEVLLLDVYPGTTYKLNAQTNTWEIKSNIFPFSLWHQAGVLSCPSGIYLHGNAGIYKLSHDGTEFASKHSGIPVVNVFGVAITSDGSLLASTNTGIGKKSGSTWTVSMNSAPGIELGADKLFSFENGHVYHGSSYSTDHGATWTPTFRWFRSATKSPDNKVFAHVEIWDGTKNVGHLYVSSDYGQTWQELNIPNLPAIATAMDADFTHVYIIAIETTGGQGLYKVNRQTLVSERIYTASVIGDHVRVQDGSIYTLYFNGFKRSDDGGLTWTTLSPPGGSSRYGFDVLQGTVWVGTGTISYSTDKGVTWTTMPHDTFAGAQSFTVDQYGYVYAGVDGVGILKSANPVLLPTYTNNLPASANISKSVNEDEILSFSQQDFTSKFSDADAGDALVKIKITSLPSESTLKLNNVAVTLNQEITLSQLSNLKLIPNSNKNGTVSFSFKPSDGKDFSENAAQVEIEIIQVYDPVVVTMNSETVLSEDFAGEVKIDFNLTDVDGVTEGASLIYALSPEENEIVSASVDQANRKVILTSLSNKHGAIDLTLIVTDVALNSVASKTFKVTVNPVNDAPDFTVEQTVQLSEDFQNEIKITPVVNVVADEVGETVEFSIDPASSTLANISFDAATGEITLSAKPDAYGEFEIVLTGDDGGSVNNTTSETITVTILPVDDLPKISVATVSLEEDFEGEVTADIKVTDVDSDINTPYFFVISPEENSLVSASVNQTDRKIIFTSVPDKSGEIEFDLVCLDIAFNTVTSNKFTVNVLPVNDPPDFTVDQAIQINEDFENDVKITPAINAVPGEEGETIGFSINPSSSTLANITFDSATGEITLSAKQDEYGEFEIILTANDGASANNTTSKTITVTVLPVGDLPEIRVENVNLEEDFEGEVAADIEVTEVDGHSNAQFLFAVSPEENSLVSVSVDQTARKIIFTSLPEKSGEIEFELTCTDVALNSTVLKKFTVNVSPVNDAPDFTTEQSVQANEDFENEIKIKPEINLTSGEEEETVEFSISPESSDLANISLDASTGEITLSAKPDAHGEFEIELTADDGQSTNNTASKTIKVKILPVNDSPVFTIDASVALEEDFTGDVTIKPELNAVTGEENQTIAYSLQTPEELETAAITVDETSGEIKLTSLPNKYGAFEVVLTANDGQSENNLYSKTITVTVAPVNDAPVFTITSSVELEEDFAGAFKIKPEQTITAGEENQTITYTLTLTESLNKAYVNFNSTTGEITFNSIPDKYGDFEIKLTANDGQSENNLYSKTIVVHVSPAYEIPKFTFPSLITLEEDFNGNKKFTPQLEETSDEGSLVFSIQPTASELVAIGLNSTTGEISFKSKTDMFGTLDLEITATRGSLSYSKKFTTEIKPVNDAPVFEVESPVFLKEDFAGEVKITPQLAASVFGEENENITYSVASTDLDKISVALDESTGVITLTSKMDEFGEVHLELTANDGGTENNLFTRKINIVINPEQEQAYPNPVSDELKILVNSKIEGDYEVTLVDHAGRIRFTTKDDKKVLTLPMSDLEPGVYFVTIKNGGDVTQMKILKI